jgi:hypothetical protein
MMAADDDENQDNNNNNNNNNNEGKWGCHNNNKGSGSVDQGVRTMAGGRHCTMGTTGPRDVIDVTWTIVCFFFLFFLFFITHNF